MLFFQQNHLPITINILAKKLINQYLQNHKLLKEDKYYLEAGLEAMLTELTSLDVIVYGSYNNKFF